MALRPEHRRRHGALRPLSELAGLRPLPELVAPSDLVPWLQSLCQNWLLRRLMARLALMALRPHHCRPHGDERNMFELVALSELVAMRPLFELELTRATAKLQRVALEIGKGSSAALVTAILPPAGLETGKESSAALQTAILVSAGQEIGKGSSVAVVTARLTAGRPTMPVSQPAFRNACRPGQDLRLPWNAAARRHLWTCSS
mmetsp:Transcript_43030/g.80094  ORF Transcript_43030/g.80094 Transcript_43030/m.80094 type:complete len:203 (-) Transcript_43030:2023-2631(-)